MKLKIISGHERAEVLIRGVAEKSRKFHVYNLNTIKCQKGCNHCCSRMAYITIAEALVIHNYLVRHKKWSEVKKRCFEMSGLSANTDPRTWFMMNIKCPVLNPSTGLCESYDVRPPFCSTHFVRSNPESCDPWNHRETYYDAVDLVEVYRDFQQNLKNAIEKDIYSITLPLPNALLVCDSIGTMNSDDFEKLIITMAKLK